MGPRFGPPPFKEQKKAQRPKNAKEFFAMLGAFFARLFYIVRLVWDTNPWILILLAVFCVADGLLPVLGAYISKDLLNAVSTVLYDEATLSLISSGNVTFSLLLEGFLGTVVFLLIFYFADGSVFGNDVRIVDPRCHNFRQLHCASPRSIRFLIKTVKILYQFS